MKKLIRFELIGLLLLLIFFVITSRNKADKAPDIKEESTVEKPALPKGTLQEDFKTYWYAADAEITSYELQQARYGETHNGQAVLIYVTEPFLTDKQVKAEQSNPNSTSVLKLNATKNFLTGIYPYSVMSSTFYPVYDNQHALKTTLSIQEWCGHVYAQINNRDQFEFTSHSYFQDEADQQLTLDKHVLEDEIWTKIRINPCDLPVGELNIIPGLEYMHLRHKTPAVYNATATLTREKQGTRTYTLTYPELQRSLTIYFSALFPHTIEGWTEDVKIGTGSNAKIVTTKATKQNTLKTPYWNQKTNSHRALRDSLGLSSSLE